MFPAKVEGMKPKTGGQGQNLSPLKIEPENDGSVQMFFLFKRVIFRFHVNFPGSKSPELKVDYFVRGLDF